MRKNNRLAKLVEHLYPERWEYETKPIMATKDNSNTWHIPAEYHFDGETRRSVRFHIKNSSRMHIVADAGFYPQWDGRYRTITILPRENQRYANKKRNREKPATQ